jgi:hypothetical protein
LNVTPFRLAAISPSSVEKHGRFTLNAVETLRLSGLRAMADGGHIGVGMEVGLMLVG